MVIESSGCAISMPEPEKRCKYCGKVIPEGAPVWFVPIGIDWMFDYECQECYEKSMHKRGGLGKLMEEDND